MNSSNYKTLHFIPQKKRIRYKYSLLYFCIDRKTIQGYISVYTVYSQFFSKQTNNVLYHNYMVILFNIAYCLSIVWYLLSSKNIAGVWTCNDFYNVFHAGIFSDLIWAHLQKKS